MSASLLAQDHTYGVPAEIQEKALLGGDLSKLTIPERLSYYNSICTSLGLNPLTRPFEYIVLNNKLTLYARKDCTEQLRSLRDISIKIMSREVTEGVYVVTAQAAMPNATGERVDESIGAVPIANVQGEARANAMMKGETKAKRRVTLSICGLGVLDESEIDSIPNARVVHENISADQVASKQTTDIKAVQEKLQAVKAQPAVQSTIPSPEPIAAQEDSFVWSVGKTHRGKKIQEIPLDYLEWFMGNGKKADHIEACKTELARVAAQNEQKYSALCEAYLENISASETVSECQKAIDAALGDENINPFDGQHITKVGNGKLSILRQA